MPNILNRKFQYSFWNANLIIVAVNVLVFFLSNYIYPYLTYMLSMMPLRILREPSSCYTFVTYMFAHGSIYHLFSNMLGLVIFGSILERRIGSKEYLLFYFLTGTLSGVLSFVFYYLSGAYFVFLLGASGALYAVMLLFAVFFPNAMVFVFGIIPVRAITLVVFYFIIEFLSSFASDGISHITHLFGLIVALLYIMIRMRINPFKRH